MFDVGQKNQLTASEQNRFWSSISISSPETCWIWQLSLCGAGYGKFGLRRNGRRATLVASRVSFYLHFGPFAKELKICHRCDNPSCCNPLHLFAGTQLDNMQDMVKKGRNARIPKLSCPHGHRYDAANTLTLGRTGHRQCLTCKRARSRRSDAGRRNRRAG